MGANFLPVPRVSSTDHLVLPPTEPPLLLGAYSFPQTFLYSHRRALDSSAGVHGLAPGRRALAPDSRDLVFKVGTIHIATTRDSLKPRATHLLFAYRIIPSSRRTAESS